MLFLLLKLKLRVLNVGFSRLEALKASLLIRIQGDAGPD